jgi:pyruvate dehydrogenase E2 component (dihydrolipoamide acetyltransferase)
MQIVMPHMGVSVEEGTGVAWPQAAGAEVRAGEPVCDIATDKVDTEVVAPADGVITKIVAAEGETIPVGEPIAEMTGEGGEPAEPVGVAAAPAEEPAGAVVAAEKPPERAERFETPARSSGPAKVGPRRFDPVAAAEAVVPTNGRTVSSPVAKRVAAEHGVDLASVSGSGIRGRIRKADVLAAIEAGPARPPAAPAGGLPRGYDSVPHEAVPLSRRRKVMAEHMIRSRQTAAHMTTESDVDMTAVLRARGERRITALSFVARAACEALREFPDLNASFDGEQLIRWRPVNLGIAVDTPEGLIVPVIHGCERLNVEGIAEAVRDVARRARDNTLTPDDVALGTFTLSNPGSVGAASAMAIINQPQVGILGMPAMQRLPWVVDGPDGTEAIAIRPIMRLALTFDHRVIDGAYATRCVVRIKDQLEAWPS